ncbi:LysR family transcriptional regulator [Streptomyces sp. SAT1]|uniref:LysR family transcriptional regulator n=1 Tax=unclassified Streptomyces TaxID=2593676 RepID=UPI001F3DC3B8|nr:LysR family transcriptional regulator [Streptomyces sp. SAT1]
MAAMPNPHDSAAPDPDPGPGREGAVPDLSTLWLRVFLEVARHGSFTVAARDLGWTQSAVSRQISALESALGGGPLFDRLPRGVRLTEAGQVLVPRARAVAESLRGAVRELTALREVTGGRLRFGAFASADVALVPWALAAFRARHPGVRVSREEGLTPGLLDRLSAGHLDLAVVSTTGSAPLEAYTLHHLLDEPLYVAVPAGHPLAGRPGPVRLRRFADADWVSGGPRPEGTLLDAALRAGFRPRVAHVVAEWTAKQGYVAAGLGVALVPALAAASVRPDVALLPLCAQDTPARAVYAATAPGHSLSPAARAFLGTLREAAATVLEAPGAAGVGTGGAGA